MKAYIAKAISAYGKLDAIWANAGIGGLIPIAEQTRSIGTRFSAST